MKQQDRPAKVVGPQARRDVSTHLMTVHQLGITRACVLIGIPRSMYRYQARRPDTEAFLARLTTPVQQKRRYGYRRFHVLLCLKGWRISGRTGYITMQN